MLLILQFLINKLSRGTYVILNDCVDEAAPFILLSVEIDSIADLAEHGQHYGQHQHTLSLHVCILKTKIDYFLQLFQLFVGQKRECFFDVALPGL